MSALTYIKNFTKDKDVAAIAPTSAFGVKRICKKIDFKSARLLVEFGPGDGVISKHLLERMHPDSRLILIEKNLNFVALLKRELNDPRVLVLHEDAGNVREILAKNSGRPVDYFLSGIPFSWLNETTRRKIVQGSFEGMRENGKFIAYQMFWQPDNFLLRHLKRAFGDVQTEFEFLNAPPLRIYEAVKSTVQAGGDGFPSAS